MHLELRCEQDDYYYTCREGKQYLEDGSCHSVENFMKQDSKGKCRIKKCMHAPRLSDAVSYRLIGLIILRDTIVELYKSIENDNSPYTP